MLFLPQSYIWSIKTPKTEFEDKSWLVWRNLLHYHGSNRSQILSSKRQPLFMTQVREGMNATPLSQGWVHPPCNLPFAGLVHKNYFILESASDVEQLGRWEMKYKNIFPWIALNVQIYAENLCLPTTTLIGVGLRVNSKRSILFVEIKRNVNVCTEK